MSEMYFQTLIVLACNMQILVHAKQHLMVHKIIQKVSLLPSWRCLLNFTVVWKLHPAISDWPLNALKLHFQSASEYFDKWCDLKNVMLNNQTPNLKNQIQFECVFWNEAQISQIQKSTYVILYLHFKVANQRPPKLNTFGNILSILKEENYNLKTTFLHFVYSFYLFILDWPLTW